MRQTFSIAMLQCSYWSKENAQMLWREEFKGRCGTVLIMSVSQMAFNEYHVICIWIVYSVNLTKSDSFKAHVANFPR